MILCTDSVYDTSDGTRDRNSRQRFQQRHYVVSDPLVKSPPHYYQIYTTSGEACPTRSGGSAALASVPLFDNHRMPSTLSPPNGVRGPMSNLNAPVAAQQAAAAVHVNPLLSGHHSVLPPQSSYAHRAPGVSFSAYFYVYISFAQLHSTQSRNVVTD